MNQTNLIDLDSFLFLQGLLDSQHLVRGLKVETLLASCEGLDKDLCVSVVRVAIAPVVVENHCWCSNVGANGFV